MAKVGVGVPTRNRGSLLHECLTCLREQTSSDFEVLVLDNESTDNSHEVFDRVVGRDARFRYHRHEVMVPVMDNFVAAVEMADTDYFMWRADDDLSSPNYIARLAECLESNPDAELAVAHTERNQIETGSSSLLSLPPFPSSNRIDRTIHLLRNKRPTWIYGLWHRTALQRNLELISGRYPYTWAADHMIMMPTVLAGRVAFADDAVFIQRILGRGAYELPTSERLEAREIYSEISRELLREVEIPSSRMAEVSAALEYHYDDRVGPYRRLKRRLLKERVLATFGFKRS